MNNHDAARTSLRRAETILEEARRHRDGGAWNLVVRRAQESVEIALKGALLWAGIDVPRAHDVGPALARSTRRFPAHFGRIVPVLASTSRELAAERERSFYGEEESGIPPEQLYGPDDAGEALQRAGAVVHACRELIGTADHHSG